MNSSKSSEMMKTSTHGSVSADSATKTWTSSRNFTTVASFTVSSARRILTTIRNLGEYAVFLALLPVLFVVWIITYERDPND